MSNSLDKAHTEPLAEQGYKGLHEFAATLTDKVRELEKMEREYRIVPGQSKEILGSIIESYVHAAVNMNVQYELDRRLRD